MRPDPRGALEWRFPAFAGLRPFRGEVLLVSLVACACLTLINPSNPQDTSRVSLSEAILLGHTVKTDEWGGANSLDTAYRKGHFYSDKAPGVSFVAIVPLGILEVFDHTVYHTAHHPIWTRRGHLWFLRVTTVGLFFLLGVVLVGRVAELISPGLGAFTAIAYSLGTITGALASSTFGHDPAATMAFLVFVLVWRRADGRRAMLAAGAAAGAAVLFDYTAATAVAILALWLLLRRAWAALGWFAVGGVPLALLLGAYDRLAFGSPFHLSYRYVSNSYSAQQAQGLFGIGWPSAHGIFETFVGTRGLLVYSPLAVIAFAGLAIAAWRRSAPARVALAVVTASAFVSFGYFDPYGGQSPGPRYLILGLPFLMLGLAHAWAHARRLTTFLVVVSIGLCAFQTVAWDTTVKSFELAYVPYTIWRRAGLPSLAGIALVWLAWLLALGVSLLLTFDLSTGRRAPVLRPELQGNNLTSS